MWPINFNFYYNLTPIWPFFSLVLFDCFAYDCLERLLLALPHIIRTFPLSNALAGRQFEALTFQAAPTERQLGYGWRRRGRDGER